LSLQDDTIWVATTDSSVYGWPAEGRTPQKVFEKGGSFLAGNLSFSRARASLEGSAPVSMRFVFFCQIIFLVFEDTASQAFSVWDIVKYLCLIVGEYSEFWFLLRIVDTIITT
jgi:hypothetical protein